MQYDDLLRDLKVAAPCQAEWAKMTGDERARFCGLCRKNVYNLSEMTASEAAALIREKEGSLCARFFRRADGTVLTSDCPVGRRGRRRRNAAALVVLCSAALGLVHFLWPRPPSPVQRIVEWLTPGRASMGVICPPTPPARNQ
jgi:hypothetical protein